MVVYWMTDTIEPGMTALTGCFLFWALQVVPSSVAFSGFARSTPWYFFGALLMGQAASRTGLAQRIAALVLHRIGTSYSRLLLSFILLVVCLQFVIPSGSAQLAIVAPVVIGIIATFQIEPHSNMAKGLFITVTYTCSIFNKMILSGVAPILARGIVEEQTGISILWSQWVVAFLPITVFTIMACWLTARWLYPDETPMATAGQEAAQSHVFEATTAWRRDERIALIWLLVALILWATDFLHHTSPGLIALGVGLLLAFPKIGLLDTKEIRSANLLLIIFVGGDAQHGQCTRRDTGYHADPTNA